MKAVGRLLRATEHVFLYISMASVLLMMTLVSIDAVARYLFSRPLKFQYELTENYLMVMAILLPLAFITRERHHIAIDSFQKYLPMALLRLLRGGAALAMIGLLAVVTYYSGLKAYAAFRLGETMFGAIDWPIGWSRIWVPLGCGLFMLRLACDLVTGRAFESAAAESEKHS